ncbi:MAG: flagellar motor protein MotB [Ignavibacteria bacterium]
MGLGEGSGPIIIQKKKKGHAGGHGGAWKVAYADFVTAMMALFIVLWILGQSKEVKETVSGYFKDPAGFNINKSKGLMNGKGPSIMDMNIKAPIDVKSEMEFKEREKEKLAKMGTSIIQEIKNTPEFKGLADQIQVQIVEEGLKIEVVDSFKEIFFEVGTSELKGKAKHLIEKIGFGLSKLTNSVVVEGHTDARPYSGNGLGYTNFELSAERANSARRALTFGGMNQNQIDEVRGYADTQLKNTEDPYDVRNRRISIIVKYSGKKNG